MALALERIWGASGEKVVEVVKEEANVVVGLQYPVPAFGELIKNEGGRAEAKNEGWVNRDQVVRVANVDLGEESAAALGDDKINCVVDSGVRQSEILAVDAVVDAMTGREG